MAGLVWQEPPQTVWPQGAEAYARAVRAGVHGVCQRYQPIIENEMKTQASWTDRSGAARQSLYAAVEPPTVGEVMGLIEFIMSHGVEHGAWLEGLDPRRNFAPTALGRKFAIVLPTLDKYAPIIWRDIRALFS